MITSEWQGENGPYKNVMHLNDLRALFPEGQISMSCAVQVFTSCCVRFLIVLIYFLSICVLYLAIFWQCLFSSRSFWWRLLFAPFCCSVALYCFHGVQMSVKDHVPRILTSGVVYKFQCGLWYESYNGECVRHLAERSDEHIGISLLTNKRVQPRKDSAVCHHWSFYWSQFYHSLLFSYKHILFWLISNIFCHSYYKILIFSLNLPS